MHMGEHHVKMKAEIRMKLLQAKGCHRLPVDHQKLGERPRLRGLRQNKP